MEDVFIPITLFGAIVAIIWLYSHYNFKKRLTAHESLRLAIEKGQKKVNLFNLGVDGYCTVNDSIGWICEALGVDPK
ncbi:MAG: hypothetical protein VXW22_14925, partial [Pseudomonadota bacterium]|nr:hypothetical protein [Pseudomonadota bacterium]